MLFLFGCHSGKAPNSAKVHLSVLRVEENLSVSIDALYKVGSVVDLAVGPKGNIYLADLRLVKIHVLDPHGHYLYAIGRRGRGPGEFEYLGFNSIQIYGDTLYVIDPYLKRLSEFHLNKPKLIRTINVPNIKFKDFVGNLSVIYPLNGARYEGISREENPFTADPKIIVSILDHNLTPIDTIVREFPVKYPFIYKNPRNRSLTAFPKTEHLVPETHLFFGSNGLLYETQSDSMHIRVFNQEGRNIRDEGAGYTPVPLTHHDIDSLLTGVDYKTRPYFYKALDQNNVNVPGYWPALQDLLVDEQGRCWVELVNPGKPKQTWWVFDTNGKPKWKFQLSRHVKLYVVRNHEAYGIWNKKGEYPRIVRYHVEGMKR